MPESTQWILVLAPSFFIANWAAVLLAAAALAWRRREGTWPRWRPLVTLAAGIARNPRMCPRTLLLAAELLILDLGPSLVILIARSQP